MAELPSTTSARVLKNSSLLLVSQVITWALTLLLSIFLPRYLGPEGVGVLALATSVWLLAAVFISFGMDTLLTREIAHDPASLNRVLGTSLWLRVLFYLISCVPVTIVASLMEMSFEAKIIVHIIGLSILFNSLAGAVQAALQGLEIMAYISISNVVSKAVTTTLGITALAAGLGLSAIAVVYVIASIVWFAAQLYFLRRHRRTLALPFHRPAAPAILRDSRPFIAGSLIMVGYGQANFLIIGTMLSINEVGWYGAASQLFGTLLFIPVALTTALLPNLMRAFKEQSAELLPLLQKSMVLILLCGVPIGLGLISIAAPFVHLLYGDAFAVTGQVLQVQGVALIFMYLNILFGQFFTSINRPNTWTGIIAASILLMVALTVMLVPWSHVTFGNGAVGGALSLLASEAVMTAVGLVLLRRQLFTVVVLRASLKILAAGIVMAIIAWSLHELFLAIPILAGAAVYITLVLLLRVLPPDDYQLLMQFGAGAWARISRRVSGAKRGESLESPTNP
jgi:O-antigen/teichoic acid export membrane protein